MKNTRTSRLQKPECNDTLVEVKRHTYFSYIPAVKKNGDEIIFHDPIREEGLISYPLVPVSNGICW